MKEIRSAVCAISALVPSVYAKVVRIAWFLGGAGGLWVVVMSGFGLRFAFYCTEVGHVSFLMVVPRRLSQSYNALVMAHTHTSHQGFGCFPCEYVG